MKRFNKEKKVSLYFRDAAADDSYVEFVYGLFPEYQDKPPQEIKDAFSIEVIPLNRLEHIIFGKYTFFKRFNVEPNKKAPFLKRLLGHKRDFKGNAITYHFTPGSLILPYDKYSPPGSVRMASHNYSVDEIILFSFGEPGKTRRDGGYTNLTNHYLRPQYDVPDCWAALTQTGIQIPECIFASSPLKLGKELVNILQRK